MLGRVFDLREEQIATFLKEKKLGTQNFEKKVEAPGEANYSKNFLHFPRLNTDKSTDSSIYINFLPGLRQQF